MDKHLIPFWPGLHLELRDFILPEQDLSLPVNGHEVFTRTCLGKAIQSDVSLVLAHVFFMQYKTWSVSKDMHPKCCAIGCMQWAVVLDSKLEDCGHNGVVYTYGLDTVTRLNVGCCCISHANKGLMLGNVT
jgi:hypothetical protein